MHYQSVRQHLRPYVIVARRRTTINHAFAAAIAPHDEYDERRVRKALEILGQSPDEPLLCAYCGQPAATWDHIYATVVSSAFSGHGHRLGNLLPCCKPCNSSKGNKNWFVYLQNIHDDPEVIGQRAERIRDYLSAFEVTDPIPNDDPDYGRLQTLRTQVLELLSEADKVASRIRARAESKTRAGE